MDFYSFRYLSLDAELAKKIARTYTFLKKNLCDKLSDLRGEKSSTPSGLPCPKWV
ncbi:hypothetical protein LV84_00116 [Algoriphagus ratkowskyi]|uniref:Uncharacterized protein n=1 Tax=Algoriphagus ratkowskyi TaxID=57028 RepID=A0A2W7RJW6_9BACT|nr:hypothetical protein LV84_00116 [Algoriphagus ratkowskyi]